MERQQAAIAGPAPHRFEHAITWSRVIGAVATVAIAPFIPNLGALVIGLLATSLLASAIVLHLLATRMRTAEDVVRLSWIVLAWDVLIVGLAQIAMTPDPQWPAIALIGVLLIISTAFRLGELGAVVSAASQIVVVLALSVWRERALGIPIPAPYVAFDLLMYFLAALLMASMLREVGGLRREQVRLMSQVGDVETLRRTTERHEQLLVHEREARTAAELAVVRLEAVRDVTENILRHSSIGELLTDTLESIARIAGARALAVLTEGEGDALVRASFGLVHQVRRPIPLQGELAEAMTATAPLVVDDASTSAIDAHVPERIESRILLPVAHRDRARMLLYVGFGGRHDFGRDDLALLGLMAERVAVAFERVERFEAERRARDAARADAERSQLLVEAADALLRTVDVDESLDRLVHLSVPRLADCCAVYLLRSPIDLACVALAADGGEREARLRALVLDGRPLDGKHPIWSVVRGSDARLIERVGPEDLVLLAHGSAHLRLLLEHAPRSWLAVPVLSDGRSLGALELYHTSGDRIFSPDDLATARAFASRVAVALTRSRGLR